MANGDFASRLNELTGIAASHELTLRQAAEFDAAKQGVGAWEEWVKKNRERSYRKSRLGRKLTTKAA